MSLLNKTKLALDSVKALSKNLAAGKDITVSSEEKDRRLDICKGCPKLKDFAGQMQCGACSCLLKLKAGLADMKCPDGKW